MSVSLSARGRKVYDHTGRCVKKCASEAAAREWVASFGNRHKASKPSRGYLVSRVTGLMPGLPGERYHTATFKAIEQQKRMQELREKLGS